MKLLNLKQKDQKSLLRLIPHDLAINRVYFPFIFQRNKIIKVINYLFPKSTFLLNIPDKN